MKKNDIFTLANFYIFSLALTGGGNRTEKKQTIIEKIKAFFEKYFGIGRSFKASEEDKQQELS